MIKPDQIPNAVADTMREFFFSRGDAQKAIAAALNAWPGMTHIIEGEPGHENAEIILPLTQEKTDE